MAGVTGIMTRKSFKVGANALAAVATLLAFDGAARAQGTGRIEIHPIPTVTVTSQQFLTGDRYGKPVTLAGELRLPRANTVTIEEQV